MIAEKIKEEMKARKMTIYKLSSLSGVQKTRIAKYLRGETDLTGSSIEKLLAVLRLELVRSNE